MNFRNEVVFVYLGNSLPKYVKPSLQLAIKFSGLRVRFIGNAKFQNQLAGLEIDFSRLEDFYDPSHFQKSIEKILLPHNFREGFWLRTLERFFVLHQYMLQEKLADVFHAELDQLLFQGEKLLSRLRASSSGGIFVPFHTKDKAVASILYCNHVDSLGSLLEFSASEINYENEMVMLAKWASQNSTKVRLLPTLATEINGRKTFEDENLTFIGREELGGVVDAAQLGLWVGGIDPRNLQFKVSPTNKFSELATKPLLSREQMNKLSFHLSEGGILICNFDQILDVPVYNLHLHSKIHLWLTKSEINLFELFRISNQPNPYTLPSTHRIKIFYLLSTGIKSIHGNPRRFLSKYIKRIRFKKFKK
jgi:hypothetical protein